MSAKGVFKRCGCRCPVTGKQLGARCGRLDEPGHGAWWFAVEGLRAADGSRSRVRSGGYVSEEAAKAAREEVAATVKGIGLTTGYWLEFWVRNVRLRPSARRNYRQHVVTYLIPQLGDLPLVTLKCGRCTEGVRRDRGWGRFPARTAGAVDGGAGPGDVEFRADHRGGERTFGTPPGTRSGDRTPGGGGAAAVCVD